MAETLDPCRMPLTSADVLGDRIEKLRDLIPEAFVEGQVDIDRLKNALGDFVGEGKERYGLTWAGKADAIRAIQAPSVGTLVPCPDDSVNFDTTENLFIEGDNLEVLKLLQKSYYGKVKMIFIDPPYNTGGEFIYPDNFREGLEEYLRYSGQTSERGARVSTITEVSGRYHSKWLDMMYPRLFLARNLLKQDGIIFISIDDHEVHNLRLLLNEVYGEENFLAHIVWQKRYVSNVTAKYLSDMHDHILVYARHIDTASINRLERTEEQLAAYKNPDSDPRGPWRAQDLSASKPYKAGLYTITTPAGLEVNPPPGRYWRCNEQQYKAWLSDNRIWFGKDGDRRPMLKAFLSDAQQVGITPNTWWSYDYAGHNKEATLEVKELFGGSCPFDTAKPVRLIERMLELCTKDDDIVLDFFAGSATTAHATLSQNLKDGGRRKFIMVQLPEPIGSDPVASQLGFASIAQIGRDRVKRVISKMTTSRAEALSYGEAHEPLGFRAFRLASSNFRIWGNHTEGAKNSLGSQLQLFAENLLPDATDDAVLYELILKAGLPLTARPKAEVIGGTTVYILADGMLVISLTKSISQDCLRGIGELKPQRVVCLDGAFGDNDQLKTNTVLEMKSHGIEFRTV